MQAKVFEGLKVIELASVLAGPSVGMFFAELGAQVIKVENPKTQGDVTRNWRLPSEKKSNAFSAYYACVNYGKSILFLDLTQKEDMLQLSRLLKNADVLLTNYKASSAAKLGLSPAKIQENYPKLIQANLTGFGPESQRLAFDAVLQAESGFMYMNGESPGRFCKMPVALIDVLAGHQLKEAVLIALMQRMKNGKGAQIEVNLMESALSALANQANNWLMNGHLPQAVGSLHPNIAPYGEIFYCKDDKPIIIAAGTQKHFENLCKALKLESLIQDERYNQNSHRVQHRTELAEKLAMAFKKQNRAEFLAQFEQKGVPAGAVQNMEEVMNTPQGQKMQIHYQLDGEQLTAMRQVAFTFQETKKHPKK